MHRLLNQAAIESTAELCGNVRPCFSLGGERGIVLFIRNIVKCASLRSLRLLLRPFTPLFLSQPACGDIIYRKGCTVRVNDGAAARVYRRQRPQRIDDHAVPDGRGRGNGCDSGRLAGECAAAHCRWRCCACRSGRARFWGIPSANGSVTRADGGARLQRHGLCNGLRLLIHVLAKSIQ
jgi:hypothetical protein